MSKILADTQIFLWSFLEPKRISPDVKKLLADKDNEIYLSAISSLEIAIKTGAGKLKLPDSPEKYVPLRIQQSGFNALPVTHVHALQVYLLPPHHKDPFDRLLIAQAIVEQIPILTADSIFKQYSVRIIDAENYKIGDVIN